MKTTKTATAAKTATPATSQISKGINLEKAIEAKAKLLPELEKKNKASVLMGLDKSIFIAKERSGSREHIYHKEVFANADESTKRTLRRELRKNLQGFISSAITYSKGKEDKKLKTLKEGFDAYYKQVYRVNDLTVASIAPNNMSKENLAGVKQMLDIFKAIK